MMEVESFSSNLFILAGDDCFEGSSNFSLQQFFVIGQIVQTDVI